MQNIRLRFFGPPTMERDGVPIPGLAVRKVLGALGYLAVRGEPVAREELAGLLWQDLDTERSRSNLRYVLHQITTQLPGCLEIRRNSLSFVTPTPYWVDLFAVRDCLAQNTPEGLEQGLGLYRGEFLEGLYLDDSPEFEAWVVIERELWRQRISGAFIALIGQQRQAGNHQAALRTVERWLTLEPWQEVAHRTKMEMLAMAGQTEVALAQYRLCVRILESELGVVPDAATRALAERIQRGELAGAIEPPTAPPNAARSSIFRLGPAPTPILGRDHEVVEVKNLLHAPDCRWLTITGASGIGKTRLAHQVAQEVASEFSGGVLWLDLAPLEDPNLILPLVAYRLGLQESATESFGSRIQEYLEKKNLLIVADNFEHLATAALHLQELLNAPESDQVRLLATSRTALHVRGEYEYPLDPLETPPLQGAPDPATLAHNPAVALLVKRIQAIKPRFQLTRENARAVAEICVRLDGLPLALELAAANIKWLPIQTIRDRLGTFEQAAALTVLTRSAIDMPPRQQTLRRAIAWSYDLLAPDEQALYARLGVFVGGWTLEFVEQICRIETMRIPDWSISLQELVNHSLVQAPDPDAALARWGMLETLREYALEQLEQHGQTEPVRSHHAAMMMEWVRQLYGAKWQGGARQRLDALDQEHGNLRAALRWSAASPLPHARELLLNLVIALTPFWYTRGYLSEAREWLRTAFTLAPTESPRRGEILMSKGMFAYRQGQLAEARKFTEEALEQFTIHGNAAGKSQALFYRGMIDLSAGELEAARTALEASHELHRQVNQPDGMVRYGLGMYFFQTGNVAEARRWLLSSLSLLQAQNETTVLAYPLLALARAASREADYTGAREYLEYAVRVLEEIGDNIELAQAHCRLGHVARLQQDWDAAVASYRASWQPAVRYGARYTQPQILEGMAGVAVGRSQYEQAAQLLGAAEALRSTLHIPIPPADRKDHQTIAAAVRAQLGTEQNDLYAQQGRKLPLDQIAQRVGLS